MPRNRLLPHCNGQRRPQLLLLRARQPRLAPLITLLIYTASLLLICCRWEALEVALATAVEVGGDMEEYTRRWESNRWWWWMGADGSMQYVGKGQKTKMRCPKR